MFASLRVLTGPALGRPGGGAGSSNNADGLHRAGHVTGAAAVAQVITHFRPGGRHYLRAEADRLHRAGVAAGTAYHVRLGQAVALDLRPELPGRLAFTFFQSPRLAELDAFAAESAFAATKIHCRACVHVQYQDVLRAGVDAVAAACAGGDEGILRPRPGRARNGFAA